MSQDIFTEPPGATELDPAERLELKPSIATRAELNEVERINILASRKWAMSSRVLARSDLLTDSFGRELHRRMFNSVWKWAGQYRTTNKNLGCDWRQITENAHNAFADAKAWLEFDTYPLHESAVRLHHRLVAIHPWSNGNGRHSRLVADVITASRDGAPLTWGANADLPGNELRARYVASLQMADHSDFGPLVAFARS